MSKVREEVNFLVFPAYFYYLKSDEQFIIYIKSNYRMLIEKSIELDLEESDPLPLKAAELQY
jgi:hypothetical protein